MSYQKVFCDFCNIQFSRKNSQVKEGLKFGWKQYCSQKCISESKITSKNYSCSNCGKACIRRTAVFKRSTTKRFFCSQSCGATYNNHLRALVLPIKTCKNCGKQIYRQSVYCSVICTAHDKKRNAVELKSEIIYQIKDFYEKYSRIPVKKEMYGAYKKARTGFGTWNNAISAAGFKPNPVMFANKYVAKDGHKCDSLAEKIIDEWFRSKNINHKRSVSYPEFKKITCDFVVKDFYIEFFGLEGQHKKYTKMVHKKRRLSKKYGIKLIELKPSHIFPKNQLDQVLSFLT